MLIFQNTPLNTTVGYIRARDNPGSYLPVVFEVVVSILNQLEFVNLQFNLISFISINFDLLYHMNFIGFTQILDKVYIWTERHKPRCIAVERAAGL